MTDPQEKSDFFGGRRVAVAIGGRHHLYRTAEAYAEVDRLEAFITERFTRTPERLRRIGRLLPGKAGRMISKAAGYSDERIDAFAEVPVGGAARRFVYRLGGSPARRPIGDDDAGGLAGHIAERVRVDDLGLHMCCGSALAAFRRTRAIAPETPLVLEQVCADRAEAGAFIAAQAEKHGLDPASLGRDIAGGFTQEKVRMNAEEIELADRVVAISGYVERSLLDAGVPAEKVIRADIAASLAPFLRINAERPSQTRRAGEPLRVALVGLHPFPKGLATLAEAAGRFGDGEVEVHVYGCDRSKVAWESAGLDRVRFHGSLARDRLAEELSACHAGCLPSLSDGFGMSALEMMALGLPVVISDRVGLPIGHGVEGLITPAGDAGALADALRTLLDEDRRAEMGSAARRRAGASDWADYRRRLRTGLGLEPGSGHDQTREGAEP